MKFALYYQQFFIKLNLTAKRFSLAMVMCFALCLTLLFSSSLPSSFPGWLLRILSFYKGGGEFSSADYIMLYSIFCCAIGWFSSLQLFWEGQRWRQSLSYVAGLPIYILISWYIQTQPAISLNIFLFTVGIFSLICIAPFAKKTYHDGDFCWFSCRLMFQLGYAFLAAIIFFAGSSAVLFALYYLFSFRFYPDQYRDLAIITFTFFFPLLTFAGIPQNFKEEPVILAQKIIHSLLHYLIVPLLLIYSLLLYAYMLKLVWAQSLPRGGVVYLVSSYGIIGIFSYLLASSVLLPSTLLSFFRTHFLKILLFPTVLLGIAIFYRIQQYGLTEGRYGVLLIGIFFTLSIIISFVVPPRFKAKTIYVCIPILLLFSSVGPWRINQLPARWQIHTLHHIFEKNHFFKDQHLKAGKKTLSREEEVQISRILDYLCQDKIRLSDLNNWLKATGIRSTAQTEPSVSSKREPKDIANVLGVDYHSFHNIRAWSPFSYAFSQPPYYYKKEGYLYSFLDVSLSPEQPQHYVLKEKGQQITFDITSDTALFHVRLEDQNLLTVDLAPVIVKLESGLSRTQEPLTFDLPGNEGMVVIHRIEGTFDKSRQHPQVRRLQFSLFLVKQ